MAKKKRTIVRVKWSKKHKSWLVTCTGTKVEWPKTPKTAAVFQGKKVAKSSEPSQLVIHKKNGKFQKEHTYPRSSDPRRSKG